jgi:hypothetical protein
VRHRIVRYYLNPDLGYPHIYDHKIVEEEVEDVLNRPGEDRKGMEGSRVSIGTTRSGRYLKVIYVFDQNDNSIFVITAYDLKGKPLTAYKRRLRKRGKA